MASSPSPDIVAPPADGPTGGPTAGPKVAVRDSDMDALHILPLAIMPIQTPALRPARLIKNVRLESVIELFSEERTGSGQLAVEDLPKAFDWPEGKPHPDLIMLRRLALLPTYDVYSLRIFLRELELPTSAELKLSQAKNRELTEYMKAFTGPLIMQIYGDDDISVQNFDDIVGLFRDPDVKKAREKLQRMADRLEINLSDVPKFLEDYGDIFLSLSYFRQCLDKVEPLIDEFLDGLSILRTNYQMKNDAGLMATCDRIQSTINEVAADITGRFENFDRSTTAMWDSISAERFRKVQDLIASYHTHIGSVLCSLTVKMDTYRRMFPTKDAGGPVRRAEFLMSEMRQGIEKIKAMEDRGPMLAALQ
ncbi:hypothetical protein [Roseospirillum parvum]|uniref:Uncharacterized protein n=1 Tax=Roseospirillum parvum TaxID=83401 RepID=A0A1G7ZG71_9PROT|nr:hypothetical protein [Roseospirillum parvum]SDH07080.1 hypothetical protein SAMN05421742_10486 [Roseospirillum parvum]